MIPSTNEMKKRKKLNNRQTKRDNHIRAWLHRRHTLHRGQSWTAPIGPSSIQLPRMRERGREGKGDRDEKTESEDEGG